MDSFNKIEIGLVSERMIAVDSTNTELVRRLQSGAVLPEGFVLSAHHQTQGRGQGGTHWHTQAGTNWTGSIYLRPAHLSADLGFRLSQVAALATVRVCEVLLREYFSHPRLVSPSGKGTDYSNKTGKISIKWPNDILVDDRKIAGILIQTGLQGQRLAWAVIGIGLNVNQLDFPPGLNRPACSLAMLIGQTIDIDEVQSTLIQALQTEYVRSQDDLAQALNQDYQSLLYRRGELATYREQGQARTFVGILRGTDAEGRLLLDGPDGRLRTYDPKSIVFV
ncbi:MAG: biotin--[acetyl-CoA-carboxylase] ligase [Bacteroidota bacterium]